jgi:hypothetical protein
MNDEKLVALLSYTKSSEELSPDFTAQLMRKIALRKSVQELQTEHQLIRSVSMTFITVLSLGAIAVGGYLLLESNNVAQFIINNGFVVDTIQQNLNIVIGVIFSTVVVLQFDKLLITLRMRGKVH